MMVTVPLYVRVMGDSWVQVAEPVRHAHSTRSITRARGHLRIQHGPHYLPRVLAWVLGLPPPDAAVETQLTVTAGPDGERWQRTLNGRGFTTRQYESNQADLAERYGVLEFCFRLDASGGGLLYVQREAALMAGGVRLRLPGRLAPHVEAREDPAGLNRVNVDVRVTLPWMGLLIAYDGIIEVEEARA
jgi:Domain of unknown function (DUF4166)